MGRLLGARGAELSRKLMFRRWYQRIAAESGEARDWTFMNYGWIGDDPALELEPGDAKDRTSIALYHHLYAKTEVADRDVLEVGSGRGGGASFAARYLKPRSILGVDYSSEAVELCRRLHADVPRLDFRVADAEALPFDDESFDVVISVEATHCFAHADRFFFGAGRVLRPGGSLLVTDFRDLDEIPAFERELAASGLELVEREDVTAGVIAALEADAAAKRDFIDRVVPPELRAQFDDFAAMQGSPMHGALVRGEAPYLAFHLVKPGPRPRRRRRR